MAAKKKHGKKPKAPRRVRKTVRPTTKRKLTKRRPAKKPSKKRIGKKKSASRQRTTSARGNRGATRRTVRSGEQAGDLQGIPSRARADSESVNELLEEGNAFEAAAVSGVEDADNNEGQEVQTHEVPEDDVPGEYLDEE